MGTECLMGERLDSSWEIEGNRPANAKGEEEGPCTGCCPLGGSLREILHERSQKFTRSIGMEVLTY